MRFLFISLLLVLVSSSALSKELGKTSNDAYILSPEDEPFINVSFGPSPYGILGIELQKGKHSVGIGFPERVSYRYYSNPYGDSLFYGLYAGRYKQVGNDEKTFDGVIYKNEENMDAGFGVGHIWQWTSGWNVAASFSIHYMDEEYSSPGQPKKKETSVILFPGITVGFKF
ncbi:MAG: hypothetical protein KAJ32_03385 [Gammaproteobacteria bacterium]|nr:hypothetical protein [Gammaproteobacteria bacterium]